MAEGNFGGGGSVIWTIRTDQLRSPTDLSLKHSLDKGVFLENGTDASETAAYGSNFVIRFLPPRDVTAEEFIKNFSRYAHVKDGRVEFKLRIEDPKTQAADQYRPQIQVGWGQFPGAAPDPLRRTAV